MFDKEWPRVIHILCQVQRKKCNFHTLRSGAWEKCILTSHYVEDTITTYMPPRDTLVALNLGNCFFPLFLSFFLLSSRGHLGS